MDARTHHTGPRLAVGLFAGLIAGAAGGLLFELTFTGLGFMMVMGPLIGIGGGAFGGAITGRPPSSATARRLEGRRGVRS